VIALQFCAPSNELLSADSDGTVLVRDVDSGAVAYRWDASPVTEDDEQHHVDTNLAIRFGVDPHDKPTEGMLGETVTRLEDIFRREWRRPLVNAVALSEDGSVALSGDRYGRVWRLDTRTGEETQVFSVRPVNGHAETEVTSIAFAGEIGEALCGDSEGIIWRIAAGPDPTAKWSRAGRYQKHYGPVVSLSLSNERKVLSASEDGNASGMVLLWDLNNARRKPRVVCESGPDDKVYFEHVARVFGDGFPVWGPLEFESCGFAPDGVHFIASGWQNQIASGEVEWTGFIELHDIRRTEKGPQILHGDLASIASLAFSRDGSTLAGGGGEYVVVWNSESGGQQFLLEPGDVVESLCFGNDPTDLFVGLTEGVVARFHLPPLNGSR
jgi:WD40 repeat protein